MASKRQAGFMLLEILVTATLLVMVLATGLSLGRAWERAQYRDQVRIAATEFAGDLRELQRNSLFVTDNSLTSIKILSSKGGYYYKKKNDYGNPQLFSAMGCGDDVYVAESTIADACFTAMGTPKTEGYYLLKHHKLENYACRISLQPVTGRVVINEEE